MVAPGRRLAQSMPNTMSHGSSGAFVRRTIDRSDARVPEHAHDWPLLSLFVMGSYSNQTEIGEQFVAGPSAVFYAAGAAHRNTAGPDGFEQIEIEFDPAWLRPVGLPNRPVVRWTGGRMGAEARAIALLCSRGGVSGQSLRDALQRFLRAASLDVPARRPGWLDQVTRQLREDPARRISELAHAAGLHPSWLGVAYRQAVGEGLTNTAARLRVEYATRLLRETGLPFAEIAVAAGFCDQSHMIRTFRRVLGRRPSTVREDRALFRQAPGVVAPRA
jgi:AraC-like DNA-binding protein